MVGVLAFNSYGPSPNPALSINFYSAILGEKNKNNWKRNRERPLIIFRQKDAAIAQWISLRLPSCYTRLKSQAFHRKRPNTKHLDSSFVVQLEQLCFLTPVQPWSLPSKISIKIHLIIVRNVKIKVNKVTRITYLKSSWIPKWTHSFETDSLAHSTLNF